MLRLGEPVYTKPHKLHGSLGTIDEMSDLVYVAIDSALSWGLFGARFVEQLDFEITERL